MEAKPSEPRRTDEQPLKTSDVYKVDGKLPPRFDNPQCFQGYSKTHVHPLYQTTNETYGSKKPTIHEMPTIFKGRNRKFSEHSLKRGMYRDNGFNTALDKTKVTGPNATAPFQDRTLYHQVYNYLSKQGNKEV
ncbi:piercer of microtubule wall 2 protein [Scleropages formosus]|uniref:piercer of microtubule wall 2 protein n=1 Tax=Scleropages formosus TaxID=113540 RepID=UPI0008780038|nr:UPF0691 protein C9orf116 homolog [Scleropages formosus]